MSSRGRETVHRSSRPRSLRNRECAASRHRRAASSAERADRALCSLVCAGTFDGSSSSVQGESLPPHLHSTIAHVRTYVMHRLPLVAGIYSQSRRHLSDMPRTAVAISIRHAAQCRLRQTDSCGRNEQAADAAGADDGRCLSPVACPCVCVMYVMFIGDLVCGPAQSVRSIYGVTCGGPRVTMPRKHNFG